MNEYEEITGAYLSSARVSLSDVPSAATLRIWRLFKNGDGRVFVPAAGPEEPNLFAVAIMQDSLAVLGEFPSLADAEELLNQAEALGHDVQRDPALERLLSPLIPENEDITRKYVTHPRAALAAIHNSGRTLFIADLIKDRARLDPDPRNERTWQSVRRVCSD